MPLFMIISGYVTKYSKEICNLNIYSKYIIKRSISYILPWFVWTVFIRGIIFVGKIKLDFKYLLWHMDSGYWFLRSLWTICMLFGLSQLITTKLIISKKYFKYKIYFVFLFTIILSCLLLSIGLRFGLSLFGIKFIIYYTPFYLIGFIFAHIELNDIMFNKIKEFVICLAFILYIIIIKRVNFINIQDSGLNVFFRMLTSLLGCICVFGLCDKFVKECNISNKLIFKSILWFGVHSLEIYTIHYLLLVIIKPDNLYFITTMQGWCYVIINMIFTITISSFIIFLMQNNYLLSFVIFGRQHK
jgi:hypothetical protein